MKFRRLLVASVMVMCGLSACGQPQATTGAGDQASQQFLAERGASPAAAGGTQGMSQKMPVIGLVKQVEGNTIKLQDPMSGTEHTIEVGADTKIRTQASVEVSAVAAGDALTAFGKGSGGEFEAEFVQIGGGGTLSGGPLTVGGPTGSDAQGNALAGGPAGGAEDNGQSVAGTVERVDGQQIVVKSADGKTVNLKLASGGSIQKEQMIQAGGVEAGKLIIANGEQKGSTFAATDIEVLPAPPAPPAP